ncbi:MAG: DUF4395 domain-containing protein [Aeromicrobium sp.]|uniref:DUF4395 domain-containing protein n=1 Tax=Aeromicrobium sp. TaxID=1871063 RepID=UPI0039E627D8
MSTSPAGQVDPRGLRFAAAITAAVLAVAVATLTALPEVAVTLTAVQAVVFALGAFLGVRYSPYARLFARFVRPRLGAPAELEDARPPRFAQTVGLAFTVVALIAAAAGGEVVALVALAAAFVAALLNAATGFCLGCEMYLLARRVAPQRA